MNAIKKSCDQELRGHHIKYEFIQGIIHMLPLCLSVLPWGILAGSMAINSGLSIGQSMGMSAILFAGAAQLVTLGLLNTDAGTLTIVLSVFFITAQHLLYGLTLRKNIISMRLPCRLSIGFLLTDELFALALNERRKPSAAYLIGAGLSFYLAWNLFSLLGIMLAKSIPDLSAYHLDFSIVATFIMIVVPMIKKLSSLLGVVFSLITSVVLSMLHIEGAVMIAGIAGMFFAVGVARLKRESE